MFDIDKAVRDIGIQPLIYTCDHDSVTTEVVEAGEGEHTENVRLVKCDDCPLEYTLPIEEEIW